MRVPLGWLRERVDCPEDPQILAERLTGRGVAVEAVERPGAGVQGLVAAEIVSAQPLADTSRLSICEVRAGRRAATVVCGAPGVAAGQLVPWAPPGARLPGGRPIAVREMHGVASQGMLCSAAELALPGGHGGLLDLKGPQAVGGKRLAPGDDLVAALELDDPVLVLELTPNYAAHCQSILGVAREVAAAFDRELHPLPVPELPPAGAASVAVEIQVPDLCPRYVAVTIDGCRPATTPVWLARRLQACGMRPLQPVVDVANYVMLELGQPLHTFDRSRLRGAIHVRAAAADERILTLDDRERDLATGDLVIADRDGPVAIAGVMGGGRTEVRAHTTNLLLESAHFGADSVARTARRLALPSEASGRFGRGADPEACRPAAARAVQLLALVTGATATATTDAGPGVPPRLIPLRTARVRTLLGPGLGAAVCTRTLRSLGFSVAAAGRGRLRATVPSWRGDVAEEVDLVEEVARAYGYDRLRSALPPGASETQTPGPAEGALATAAASARTLSLAGGFSEITPYSFHAPADFDRLRLPADHPWRDAVAIGNPMGEDQRLLRTTLAVGLLRTLEVNARQHRTDAAVFEVGPVYVASGGARPAEPVRLGVAGYGRLRPSDWHGPADPVDFWCIKGLFEALAARLGLEDHLTWRPAAGLPLAHPGRAAEAWLGGLAVGWACETHPEVIDTWQLPCAAALGELDLEACAAAAQPLRAVRALPRHPASRRDIALIAPRHRPTAELSAVMREAAGPLLADLRLFDVYEGERAPAGSRFLAFSFTWQAPDRTLTDAEVAQCDAAVRQRLAGLPDVRLRGAVDDGSHT